MPTRSSSFALRNAVLFTILAISVVIFSRPANAQDVLAKAKKYHSILAKRPTPGYLFDRFYDAWLEQDSVETLQTFLEQKLKQNQPGGQARSADRLLLAFFHAKQGDDPLSLEQFRLALKDDPGNAALWYEKAVVEARTLDYETAIADCTKAGEQKADKKLATKIAKLKGKLYARNRQTEKAIEVWQQMLAKNPTDEDLYEDIIELQLNEGLYDEAAKLSESLVAKTRDAYKKVIRSVRTGDIYQRGGKREKALEVYASNLQKVGANTWIEKEVLAQIEQLFRREDDLSGLEENYKKILADYPQRVLIRKRYAELLVDLGQKEKAIKQFEEILELTPGNRPNREEYISMLVRLEKLPQAATQLGALIKQNEDDPELRLQLANLLHKQGDKKGVASAVQQFLSVSEKKENAFLRAARVLGRFELLDEATTIYESLVKAFPDSMGAKEAYAAFLYDRRKLKEPAIKIWQKLAEGTDRSQLVRVARILAARREHQPAFNLLKKREADFGTDPIFLGQLINESVALNKFEQAIPWASKRVQSASNLSDLESAIAQAADVISKADKAQSIIAKLTSNKKLSTQQSCLLAELHEREGDSDRADAELAKAEAAQAAGRKLFIVSQQIRLLTQRRDWNKAAVATKKLIGLPGGRKSIYVRRLVELYQRDYKFDEALTWVQQWKKLSPGSTLPWFTESRILSTQGKSKESLDVLRSAVQLFDADVDLRARLAQAYSESQKTADATRIYWRLYEDSEDVGEKLRWAQELGRVAQQGDDVDRLIERFEERRQNNRQSIVR